MRLASRHSSSIFGKALRRMAQSMPRASLKPEIWDNTSLDDT